MTHRESMSEKKFVESSVFMDDLSKAGENWQRPWHFCTTPWLEEGGALDAYPDFVWDKDNCIMAT